MILGHAPAEVRFEVGVHGQVIHHIRAGVTDRQAGAPPRGRIGRRAVDGPVVMQRDFTGFEFELHRRVFPETAALQFQRQDRVGLTGTLVLDEAPADEISE